MNTKTGIAAWMMVAGLGVVNASADLVGSDCAVVCARFEDNDELSTLKKEQDSLKAKIAKYESFMKNAEENCCALMAENTDLTAKNTELEEALVCARQEMQKMEAEHMREMKEAAERCYAQDIAYKQPQKEAEEQRQENGRMHEEIEKLKIMYQSVKHLYLVNKGLAEKEEGDEELEAKIFSMEESMIVRPSNESRAYSMPASMPAVEDRLAEVRPATLCTDQGVQTDSTPDPFQALALTTDALVKTAGALQSLIQGK